MYALYNDLCLYICVTNALFWCDMCNSFDMFIIKCESLSLLSDHLKIFSLTFLLYNWILEVYTCKYKN